MPKLIDIYRAYRDERAVAVHATTLASDYARDEKWLERCPYQDLGQLREAMTWTLQQTPRKSAIKVAARIKSVARWATSEDVALLERNTVRNFPFPKPEQREDVVVIPDRELPLLFCGLEAIGDQSQYARVARLMGQTALRTGEAFAIHLGDIRGAQLEVHRNMTLTHGLKNSTKTNRRRKVPLNPVALDIIERQRPYAQDGFLFPIHRDAFGSFWDRRVKRMVEQGVLTRKYRPYDLRHTTISHWLQRGVSVQQAARWAGNSAQIIFQHYAGVTTEIEMPVI